MKQAETVSQFDIPASENEVTISGRDFEEPEPTRSTISICQSLTCFPME
jgi:hypothetical protein